MYHRATKSYHVVQARRQDPTVDIAPRASSSSSGTSDADRCDHNKSAECQKPVSNNALTISLAVVLPSVVIFTVLGLLLYRNYRKDKKEAMEHDPDFDENGEATALPDLPHPKYNMEDPFHNRNSLRYPQAIANAGSKNSFNSYNKSSTSLAMSSIHGGPHGSDPYLDTFVLPYQHQTGSKASLDDYARHFGMQGFDGTHRSSTYGNRTRNSSISRFPAPGAPSNISPQKSNLRTEISSTANERSPVKRLGEKEYTTLPDHSTTSIGGDRDLTEFSTASDIESVTNSEDSDGEKYSGGIKYENESSLEANNNSTAPTPFFEGVQGLPPTLDSRDIHGHPAPDVDTALSTEQGYAQDPHHEERLTSSPFEDAHNDTTANTSNTLHYEDKFKNPHDITDDHVDGDFNFTSDNNTTHDQSQMNLTQDSVTMPLTKSKSPRISQFNLLKNDSDDDDYEHDGQGEDFDGQALDEEQQEELKRMKSVYRVYFDGEAAPGAAEQSGFDGEERQFKHDPSQPVPQININSMSQEGDDRTRINRDLKMDTNYDKRMTTTSSIYTETPAYNHEQQHYNHPQQGYTYGDQYHEQQQQQYQQQPSHMPPQAPLQRLRNASDIRKSTLQTYTDFQPRTTNPPTQRQPFNPIEGWTSPKHSPVNQSQSSFVTANGSSQSILPPSTSSTSLAGTLSNVPSATQLARNSVVMINPVTEITKQRTFKPAGSLPSGSAPSPPNVNGQFHNGSQNSIGTTDGSLIPGNRKSDVRRMMNTNF